MYKLDHNKKDRKHQLNQCFTTKNPEDIKKMKCTLITFYCNLNTG